MSEDLRKNGEGYCDKTAYAAMKNVMKEEETVEVKRGEIWEVDQSNGLVKEVLCIQPFSGYFEHIMLTDKKPGENSVIIRSREMMYSDVGRVSYSLTSRAASYIRTVPEDEMAEILKKIACALNIGNASVTEPVSDPYQAEKVIGLEKERDIYKHLYNDLLEKVISGRMP